MDYQEGIRESLVLSISKTSLEEDAINYKLNFVVNGSSTAVPSITDLIFALQINTSWQDPASTQIVNNFDVTLVWPCSKATISASQINKITLYTGSITPSIYNLDHLY